MTIPVDVMSISHLKTQKKLSPEAGIRRRLTESAERNGGVDQENLCEMTIKRGVYL
jgi:hypothetical protein